MKKFAKKIFESIWPLIFEFSQYILGKKIEKKLCPKISHFHVRAIIMEFTLILLYRFQFFEKIIKGQYPVGIFLNRNSDSIGKNPYENM